MLGAHKKGAEDSPAPLLVSDALDHSASSDTRYRT